MNKYIHIDRMDFIVSMLDFLSSNWNIGSSQFRLIASKLFIYQLFALVVFVRRMLLDVNM